MKNIFSNKFEFWVTNIFLIAKLRIIIKVFPVKPLIKISSLIQDRTWKYEINDIIITKTLFTFWILNQNYIYIKVLILSLFFSN